MAPKRVVLLGVILISLVVGSFVLGSYFSAGKFPIKVSFLGGTMMATPLPSTSPGSRRVWSVSQSKWIEIPMPVKPSTDSEIRSICSKEVQELLLLTAKEGGTKMNDRSLIDFINLTYRLCLTKYGMKPEDLL